MRRLRVARRALGAERRRVAPPSAHAGDAWDDLRGDDSEDEGGYDPHQHQPWSARRRSRCYRRFVFRAHRRARLGRVRKRKSPLLQGFQFDEHERAHVGVGRDDGDLRLDAASTRDAAHRVFDVRGAGRNRQAHRGKLSPVLRGRTSRGRQRRRRRLGVCR